MKEIKISTQIEFDTFKSPKAFTTIYIIGKLQVIDKEIDAFETEIDDFIEQWHESSSHLSLAEFLGFTEEEYALWVEQPESIRSILFCRQYHSVFAR